MSSIALWTRGYKSGKNEIVGLDTIGNILYHMKDWALPDAMKECSAKNQKHLTQKTVT